MGEVIPFPTDYDRSTIAQLTRDNCKVRFDFTVDAETALQVLVAIGRLDIILPTESITIIKPG